MVLTFSLLLQTVKQNFGYIRNSESTVKQPPISRPNNCGLLNYQHHSFDGSLLSNKNSNSSNSSNNNSSNNSSCSPAATGGSLLNGFASNGGGLNGSSAINSLAAAMNNLNAGNSTNSNSGSLCNNLLQENIANLYEKWSMGCGSGGSPDSGLFTNSTSISDPSLLDLSSSKLSSVSGNLSNGSALTSLVNAHQQSQMPVGSSMVSQLAAAQQQLLPIKSQVKRQKMIYHCKFGEFGVMEGQFTEPSGVAVNAQNDVIVADTNNHRIQIFDKEGRFKFQFGECGKKDGQLLYPNRVAVVKASGKFSKLFVIPF